MKALNPQKFFYALCGLLVLLVVGGGWGYSQAVRQLQASRQTLQQRLADQQAADDQLSKLTNLQSQYRRLQPVLTKIAQALPADKQQSELALQLQNIATDSGMSINSISFDPSVQPGPTSQTVKVGDVYAVPVSFELVGTYDQLQDFLHRQENLSRYTSLTSLDISGSGNALHFAVKLNAFFKP